MYIGIDVIPTLSCPAFLFFTSFNTTSLVFLAEVVL